MNNALFVGGPGNGNTLTIENSGRVSNTVGKIGGSGFPGFTVGNDNAVYVRSGGIWTNNPGTGNYIESLTVGSDGAGNSLTVSNGGKVYGVDIYVGFRNATNNTLRVLDGGLRRTHLSPEGELRGRRRQRHRPLRLRAGHRPDDAAGRRADHSDQGPFPLNLRLRAGKRLA
jgi:hypothetical protein